jgi:hypothetical protein
METPHHETSDTQSDRAGQTAAPQSSVLAIRLDVSEWHIHCAVEPGFREHRMARQRPRQRADYKRPTVNSAVHHQVRYVHRHPPPEVLREAELALELRLQPRSVTAELLGDPISGRSALDQKLREKKAK